MRFLLGINSTLKIYHSKILLFGRNTMLGIIPLIFSYKTRLYLHPFGCSPLREIIHLFPYSETNRIVVEPSSVRGLAADCPLKKSRGFNLALIQIIFSVFTTFTLEHISSLRCGLFVFRVFQQFNESTYCFHNMQNGN